MILIFLSSTSTDLEDHRQAVIDTLLKGKMFPNAMEHFGAQVGDAVEVSLGELKQCDLFIGIYAHRYGYQPGGGKSITEMEYDYAVELKKPCLVFMVEPDYKEGKLKDCSDTETDPDKKELLEKFKKRLENEKVRAKFTTPDSLAREVAAAVLRWFQDTRKFPERDTLASEKPQQIITTGDIDHGFAGNISGGNVNINFGDTNPSDKKGS